MLEIWKHWANMHSLKARKTRKHNLAVWKFAKFGVTHQAASPTPMPLSGGDLQTRGTSLPETHELMSPNRSLFPKGSCGARLSMKQVVREEEIGATGESFEGIKFFLIFEGKNKR